MERCKKCQGTGWIPRDKPFICPGLHTDGIISCMLCENVSKGNYITCDECYGAGEKIKSIPREIKMIR